MVSHFQFVVRKEIRQKLGLCCGFDDDQALFRVEGIEEGGVIDKKNAKLASCRGDIRHQVLRAGDLIECVNVPSGHVKQVMLEPKNSSCAFMRMTHTFVI